MTLRAKYNGVVPVQVTSDPQDIYAEMLLVQPGELLPLETPSGKPVPVAVRDDLLKNHGEASTPFWWSEFNQADQKSSAKDDQKAGA